MREPPLSRWLARSMAAALLLAACPACQSPEATRARGGRGADVGNRGPEVDVHGKTDPFHGTPRLAASAAPR